MRKEIAFYGGSFDPFTEGHRLCLCHAITMYDKIVVGVGVNPDKEYLISAEDRVNLINASLSDFVSMFKHRELIGRDFSLVEQIAAERLMTNIECVEVISYSGLTIDAAIECKASVLIRGERLVGDHDAEMQLAHINRELCDIRGYNLQTVTFPVSKAELTYVSSTNVKKLIKQGEYIAAMKYVSPSVHNFLCQSVLRKNEYPFITSDLYYSPIVEAFWGRKYHNFSHIAYMLNFLHIFQVLHHEEDIRKKAMKIAILWHDFECFGENPELVSAQKARNVAWEYCFEDADFVKKLVLATNHKDVSIKRYLENLIHDLDLLILGDRKNYGTYAWSIKSECEEKFSYEEYVKGRIKILNVLLDRPSIYLTPYFYKRFEDVARMNVCKERDYWLSKKVC